MENSEEKSSRQTDKEQQPGSMSSFNNRNEQKSTEVENTESKGKDESESYSDYNGNSEQNAPAKSSE